MNSHSSHDDSLGVEDERKIIEVLDAFEKELRQGGLPETVEWVEQVEPRLRPVLAQDLNRMRAEFKTGAVEVERTQLSRADAANAKASMLGETVELLRIRLRAAAIFICLAIGVFLIHSLFFRLDMRLMIVRASTILVSAAMVLRLRPAAPIALRQLRGIELTLLAIVGIHAMTLQATEMLREPADAVNVNAALLFAYTTWCVINMAYGMLIPNNWRRAAAILTITAAIPFAFSYVIEWWRPDWGVVDIREELRYSGGLLTLVASGTAVAAAYTMNHLRKELFQAKRYGRYRLVKRLGRGGMGEVFLAEHQLLKRPSAIKLIRPGYDTNEDAIRRFEREVQATATLSHWNTVEIFDYGRTDDGAFYYVMEYLNGLSLQQLVERHGPLPAGRVVYLLAQVCSALCESHEEGLIHRDIKPANIFAAKCGNQCDVAKLLDFGLVHEMFAFERPTNEQSAIRFVGTPQFLAPEQAMSGGVVDARSDIYAVGATAYFLLTSQPPFNHKNVSQCIQAHLTEDVTPPSQHAPGIDDDLERVVLRCLAKEPDSRYKSAAELGAALANCRCARDWSSERARSWWQGVGPH